MRGRVAFANYVRSVRASLSDYCKILDCVSEGDKAFAQMRFSGLHTGMFRTCAATGKPIQWFGAATVVPCGEPNRRVGRRAGQLRWRIRCYSHDDRR
jgi:hypothetical protein